METPAHNFGFADDATLWEGPAFASGNVTAPLSSLTPGIRTRQFYTMRRPNLSAGLLIGDILVAEAKPSIKDGDLVIANFVDEETATSVTLVRQIYAALLVPAAGDDPHTAVALSDANIVAKVISVYRINSKS